MYLTIISISAIILYVSCSIYLGGQAWHGIKHPKLNQLATTAGFIALAGHAYILHLTMFGSSGVDFSVLKVASLSCWLLTLSTLCSSLRLPVNNLLTPLYLLSAITLVLALSIQSPPQIIPDITYSISVHILLSILAYCVFTVAAMQAVIVGMQDRLLRQHKTDGFINTLPPLQTMETLLFDMLWTGQVLLSAALAIGFYANLETPDALSSHKVVFAIISWGLFSVLLWGRHRLGWRGQTAINWTLVGFAFLMLSYFGSKLVFEFLLS